jgi:hypothetical protein
MTKFDVNELLFSFDAEMDDTYLAVFDWLDENIGKTTERNKLMNDIYARGDGWVIRSHKEKKRYMVISWTLEIEDPEKAFLFALKWGLNGSV